MRYNLRLHLWLTSPNDSMCIFLPYGAAMFDTTEPPKSIDQAARNAGIEQSSQPAKDTEKAQAAKAPLKVAVASDLKRVLESAVRPIQASIRRAGRNTDRRLSLLRPELERVSRKLSNYE
jgi:hypothetical protein